MKLHHTKYKKNYSIFILDSIKPYEEDQPIKEDQKLNYLIDTFKKESGFNNKTDHFQNSFSYWLSGLPSVINLPFYNEDVIDLAVKMGSIEEDPNQKTKDKITNNYFNFMSYMVLDMKLKQDLDLI